MRLDSNWLFFNIEGLSSDPTLETAMSMLIANATAERASGRSGQPSITVLDECWALLDSPTLAPEVVQLFRTARKRYGSVWGISQTVEDFVGTESQSRVHGPGILKNATTKIVGQQPGDTTPLAKHLFLNPVAISEVKEFSAPRKGRGAEALLVLGEKAETTQVIRLVPTPIDYWVCTTFPRGRRYRNGRDERDLLGRLRACRASERCQAGVDDLGACAWSKGRNTLRLVLFGNKECYSSACSPLEQLLLSNQRKLSLNFDSIAQESAHAQTQNGTQDWLGTDQGNSGP